jgi:outer membrane lipoprotein-sorting protein
MTRCAYVESRLRPLVDGELDPGENRKVLAHVERCASCRREYAGVRRIAGLLQEQPLEDVPPHFTASLQVRLAAHRRARAAGERPRRPFLRTSWTRPLRIATALAVTAGVAALGLLVSVPRISASEVALRAERSWMQIRNYGCVFISRGVYQGQERTFRQRQFFRRPGEFRLDTAQDYPLTTYVFHDRVVHFLPGGDWKRKGPLVIVRPRLEGQDVLPFPFGVNWRSGGNVSLEQLVRQLRHKDAQLLGKEGVSGRDCYHLRFVVGPEDAAQKDRYDMWIDAETFLPRRVHWFRDENNHIDTVAEDLRINDELMPAGTFEFRTPANAYVIHGDVDPHVFALPLQRARDAETRPVQAANDEAWLRARDVPFGVMTPGWLPDGFELVRARRKLGRWVDSYWIRENERGEGEVLTLVHQDARGEPASTLGDAAIEIGDRRLPARVVELQAPHPHVHIVWRLDGARVTLSAAGISREEALRVAGSLRSLREPEPAVSIARGSAPAGPREPSELPTNPESFYQEEPRAYVAEGEPGVSIEQPMLMPEMPDADPVDEPSR